MQLWLLALFAFCTTAYIVEEDQVTFFLYTRDSGEVQITQENIDTIDTSKTFHFIIHGWVASHALDWVQSLTDAYLEREDCNVIQVDWQAPAFESVYVSANNTKGVGILVGNFITQLSVNPAAVNLVGHSFGSQVCGFAGKEVFRRTGAKVGRITVTDPARRPFESTSISRDERVNSEDALLVVGIHSDAGVKGFLNPLGKIDFYPNGGVDPQPSCENSSDTHGCSHNIVNYFFIEAIRNPTGFTATKCDSYEHYLAGVCSKNDNVTMGGTLAHAEGVFYFQTNPVPPYSKG